MINQVQISPEETETILNDLVEVYGYDFTSYSRASLVRRINRLISMDRFTSFAEFRFRVRDDEHYLRRFVEQITVNVTEMFRDTGFHHTLRTEILPALATKPLIRIWHAGCSTGEEVYSMAILLEEVGLLGKSLLYATDLNPSVLETVRKGFFPMRFMKQYSENYILSGGTREFSTYYTAQYDLAKFDSALQSRLILSTHNLVSDGSFNEFHLILCRNVMIYFDKDLQERALQLFDDSLETLGYLALGTKETIKFSGVARKYKQVKPTEKIWKKIA